MKEVFHQVQCDQLHLHLHAIITFKKKWN
uniref:Uncharacterized protein n=1 Tax=Anguilla anguilla TaxID=7936 RepID=A0A0E9QFR6_ANGAN